MGTRTRMPLAPLQLSAVQQGRAVWQQPWTASAQLSTLTRCQALSPKTGQTGQTGQTGPTAASAVGAAKHQPITCPARRPTPIPVDKSREPLFRSPVVHVSSRSRSLPPRSPQSVHCRCSYHACPVARPGRSGEQRATACTTLRNRKGEGFVLVIASALAQSSLPPQWPDMTLIKLSS
jgi:hypothetical protein